jgi:hypothetical protein
MESDRINRIGMIYFRFPEEIENILSPSAKYNFLSTCEIISKPNLITINTIE